MSEDRKARDLKLLDAVDAAPRKTFKGDVWRVARQGRDALNGSRIPARWNPGTFDALYTSLAANTALSEIYFHLARQPVFPSKLQSSLHRIAVDVSELLLLNTLDELSRLDVDSSGYNGLDYTRTQDIADAAYFLGFHGLIAPSARASGLNLILFVDKIDLGALSVAATEPVDWPVWRKSSGPNRG
jgi:RES domain-containing protein